MMKLILSLTLIWTLSSTAEALQCLHGLENDKKYQTLRPCNSTELCATAAFKANDNKNAIQHTLRKCLPSSLFSEGKHTFSVNVGFAAISANVHVCNTDGCNSEDIPYPGVQKKNNLKCFACDDRSSSVCDKTVQCVGEQNHCISGTVVDKNNGEIINAFGCVTANLCEVAPHFEKLPVPFKFNVAPECNSAWSVKLNVIPLLFGLITLIVL